MKNIKRSDSKMSFHFGGLKTDKLMEGLKERVPTEEEDPREAPHKPLRSPVARVKEEEQSSASHRLWEREREALERKATVQGFKYPWTRAWPNNVLANQTLSGPCRTLSGSARLCPVRTFCLEQIAD
jgi:hypothetical protein